MPTRIVLIFMIMIAAVHANGQKQSTYLFERRVEGPIVDFTVDNLGNMYLVYKSDQIKKINTNGDSVGVFNAVRKYGQLYSIDATNPLKLVLYYKNFSTILALDRFLSVRNTIDLRNLDIFQAKAVGLAYDGNVWVFDEQDGKLKKISEEGKIIDQTNDLRRLFDSLPSPHLLVDQGKLVYLYDSTKGLYMFDYYGALKNRVRLLNWRDVTVVDQTVFGRNKTHLLRYDAGTLNLQELPMPAEWQNATRIHITPRRIYVLNNGLLEIYAVP